MLPGAGMRPTCRTAPSKRGAGAVCRKPSALHIDPARHVMGMRGGRSAGLSTGREAPHRCPPAGAHQPAAPRVGGEHLGQMPVEFRPGLALPLPREPRVIGQPPAPAAPSEGVELRLDGAHGDELGIRAAVGGVEVRAVEVVVARARRGCSPWPCAPSRKLQDTCAEPSTMVGIDHRADAPCPARVRMPDSRPTARTGRRRPRPRSRRRRSRAVLGRAGLGESAPDSAV